MFLPKSQYDVIPDKIDIRDFHLYTEEYVTRPPYQRKNVWSTKKQQALLDSLFRRYYIPKLVLREVRLGDDRGIKEVVDGQQRIVTAQRFFTDELKLPDTLASLDTNLPGKRYSELPDMIRKFVDKELKYEADIIKNIDNPKSPEHQRIATEIFWRLQQGESLNFMEIAHARLSSLVRNFIVKYADDISFDYAHYTPIDQNPFKHNFFKVIDRKNDRMQHLALLGRLLLIEKADGPTDIRDSVLGDLIDDTQQTDGIGNLSFEKEPEAVSLLKTLSLVYEIFRDDPALDEKSGMKEFTIEYFIISMVMLVRHLRNHYAFSKEQSPTFKNFLYQFHNRWKTHSEEDRDILVFADNRQQGSADLETRDRMLRLAFFEFLEREGMELKVLDTKRAFNEAERIRVYRRQDGLCQICVAKDRSPEEARVSWSQYQADHIFPWIKGGKSVEQNAQVLCAAHNASKGGR